MDSFRQAITISSICNMVFRAVFLKPDLDVLFRECVTVLGIASLLMIFNGWCTLVGHVTTLFMAVMGGTFICQGYLMRNLMFTVQRRMKCLSTSGAFGKGDCMQNRHRPIGKDRGKFAEQI